MLKLISQRLSLAPNWLDSEKVHMILRFRQYGLWEQYADIYRNEDLKYTLGVSDYTQDWFFAHVTRYIFHLLPFMSGILVDFPGPGSELLVMHCRDIGNRTYEATTWQIMFELPYVDNQGNYTLQVALASATDSELQV